MKTNKSVCQGNSKTYILSSSQKLRRVHATHLSQTHHTCLYIGNFKRLKYFDAALPRASETAVMKMLTESLSAPDLSIHAQCPIKHWKSVFCMENEQKLNQEIFKIL